MIHTPFQIERNVYHEQYENSDFPNLNFNHIIEVVALAFDKSDWLFLATEYCDWSFASFKV